MNNVLPPRWKLFFSVEIPICLVTCIYWFVFPGDYFDMLFGLRTFDPSHYILLQLSAILTFTIYVWFYSRMLLSKHLPLEIFRYFQEAVTISDILVLITCVYIYTHLSPQIFMLGVQIGMTAFWLVVRVVFLVRVRA